MLQGSFAIIGSSGGAAFAASDQILQRLGSSPRPLIITDRSCGLEDYGRSRNYPVVRLPFHSARQFSQDVAVRLREHGILRVILMYTRLISDPLVADFEVHNIHPSMLPSYKGMRAVEQAVAGRADDLGCSLHRVDLGMDTGPLLAQVSTTLPRDIALPLANRLSFLQKVWLLLVWHQESPLLWRPLAPLEKASPGIALATHNLLPETRLAYDFWARQLAPPQLSQ